MNVHNGYLVHIGYLIGAQSMANGACSGSVYRGLDGRVRFAQVKTAGGVFTACLPMISEH